MDINARACSAATDEREFERLLTEYRPYIASCASKTAGRHIDLHDDEMSVALIAFSEAVRRYRPESGKFLPFAANVIRSRLIDQMREAGREPKTCPLETAGTDSDSTPQAGGTIRPLRLVQPPESRYEDPLKLEILCLTESLSHYRIAFSDVAACSPRAEKTKRAARRVAEQFRADPALLSTLRKTGQLPMIELEKRSGVSRKIISRHRNYIVCLAEILSGEYECLSEYVSLNRKGETI